MFITIFSLTFLIVCVDDDHIVRARNCHGHSHCLLTGSNHLDKNDHHTSDLHWHKNVSTSQVPVKSTCEITFKSTHAHYSSASVSAMKYSLLLNLHIVVL